jgi:hypothetical protein
MGIPFVGKRFKPSDFPAYLGGVTFGGFVPQFVTLHHTASPSLAMRPSGFSDQHLKNLRSYYEEEMGWSGAPHLFIDDRPDGIIVFQRLDRQGVHAKSFNAVSWGVEMLGDFDSEKFDTGRGAAVRDMAMEALAAMCRRLNVPPATIRFHRDDPKTTKTCPGTRVSKQDVVARVSSLLKTPPPPETAAAPGIVAWKVTGLDGKPYVPVHTRDGRPAARVRQMLDHLQPGGTYKYRQAAGVVEWTSEAGVVVPIPVWEDENGATWAFLRDLTDAAGRQIQVKGTEIVLS